MQTTTMAAAARPAQVFPERVPPESLDTSKACQEHLKRLDEARYEVESQLWEADERLRRFNQEAPLGWVRATRARLHRIRRARGEVQDRKGLLRRAENEARAAEDAGRRGSLFVAAARRALPKEVFLSLWEEVDRIEKTAGKHYREAKPA